MAGRPTLNLTEGCCLGCVYCYTRSYSGHPGQGRIVVFENTPELLEAELGGKRRRPAWVSLSPSSDAFQYPSAVRELAMRSMRILLEARVGVSVLTKGFITRPAVELFARHRRLVHVTIGLTTLSPAIRAAIEPRTAPANLRLATLHRLREAGVSTGARLDPLIPGLTDTDENARPVLAALAAAGIREAAVSYVFLRSAWTADLLAAVRGLGVRLPGTWAYRRFSEHMSGGKVIDAHYRREGYARLLDIGRQEGVELHICGCKNPELEAGPCGARTPETTTAPDSPPANQGLFEFMNASPGGTVNG